MNQELLSPALQRLKGLRSSDIVYEHAAVSTAIECNTKRLEALLTSGIPDL